MNGLNAMIAQGYQPTADIAGAQRNALLIQGGQLDLQNKQRDIELRPMKDDTMALEYMINIAPSLTFDKYRVERQRMLKMGITPQAIPDDNFFNSEAAKNGVSPEQYFDYWRDNYWMTGMQKQALRLKTAGEGWKPGSKSEAIEVASARGQTRKIGDKQTYQKGDQEITERWNGTDWEIVGSGPKWNPKSDEFEVVTDKEGNVTVRKGPAGAAGGAGMTKPTQTKIEGKLFDSTNALYRLQRIEESFKPEYMTWKTRLGQQVTSWKAKAGMGISPEDKQKRVEFAQFQRRSMSNLNQYLNELSGAAITTQEAERLGKAMPHPEKDDPIEFESKMRDVMEDLKLGIARYNYLLANGWSEQQVIGNVKKNQIQSIGSFRSQIQARAKEIEEELRASGTDDRDIRTTVTDRLRQEFKL